MFIALGMYTYTVLYLSIIGEPVGLGELLSVYVWGYLEFVLCIVFSVYDPLEEMVHAKGFILLTNRCICSSTTQTSTPARPPLMRSHITNSDGPTSLTQMALCLSEVPLSGSASSLLIFICLSEVGPPALSPPIPPNPPQTPPKRGGRRSWSD